METSRNGYVDFLWRLLAVLVSTYMVIFMSEHVFWGKPGDGWRSILEHINPWSWRAYFLAAYSVLAMVYFFRVRNFWAMFIVGGVFGWLIEAAVVNTTYNQLPWNIPAADFLTTLIAASTSSISVTGLSWHALLSVCVMWYLMRRELAKGTPMRVALVAGGVGLYWAVWGVWWWTNDNRVAPLHLWVPYVFVLALALMAAYWVLSKVPAASFHFTRTEAVVLLVLNYWFFIDSQLPDNLRYFARITFVGFEAKPPVAHLVFPALMLAALIPLWWNRDTERRPNAIVAYQHPIPWTRFLALLAMPIVAAVVYAAIYLTGTKPATGPAIYVIEGILGYLLYAIAVCVLFAGWLRRRKTTDAAQPPAGAEAAL